MTDSKARGGLIVGGEGFVEHVHADARTLGDLFLARERETPDRPAIFLKRDGQWLKRSWREWGERARAVAGGLMRRGLEPGDRMAILGPTSAEWAYHEIGGQLAGLVTFGIYPKQSVEQIRYLLEHSGARWVSVAEATELENVLAACRDLPQVEAIVPWTSKVAAACATGDSRLVAAEAVEEELRGEPASESAIRSRLESIPADEMAMLIYTSGTTGPPKGAMITHENVLAMAASLDATFRFRQDDLLISFLPMAHVTERNLGFYGRVSAGVAAAYPTSIGAVLQELPEIRPTVFGAVPRLFEKAYDRVHAEIERKPKIVRELFSWASDVGRERARYRCTGERMPALLELKGSLADRLVFRKITAAFGGRLRACITGAAPISREILEFFWGAGMPVYEGYGMTEATVITNITLDGAAELGTVGGPIPPIEQKIAEDGEILLRGPIVFKGYYKNPEATAETVQNGWLHSGDIGKFTPRGSLMITDRKKHIIVTAGGKNVAPANIERAIKNQSPLISQVHAHGDRRPFVSALLAPSPLETLQWGCDQGIVPKSELEERTAELLADPAARSEALAQAMATVVAEPRFIEEFLEPVRRGNEALAQVERVKRFVLLTRDFSQEEGELTPTMKMRRKAIEEKHRDLFDRIYADPGFGLDA